MSKTSILKESPSQTAGPYVHIGCVPNFAGLHGVFENDLGASLLNDNTQGERIRITGQVFDGEGVSLTDALLEIWQADANGLYQSPLETRGKADPNFAGWGRAPVDMETGDYQFETIRPGSKPDNDGRLMNPFITFWIVARGINIGLQTRMYFPEHNILDDPFLSGIVDKERLQTLVARRLDGNEYRFDIHLQGDAETVFFDI